MTFCQLPPCPIPRNRFFILKAGAEPFSLAFLPTDYAPAIRSSILEDSQSRQTPINRKAGSRIGAHHSCHLDRWPVCARRNIGRLICHRAVRKFPSGQLSAIASSPQVKLWFEIVISFAGPSKCTPSVLGALLFVVHPDTVTCPTFESRM